MYFLQYKTMLILMHRLQAIALSGIVIYLFIKITRHTIGSFLFFLYHNFLLDYLILSSLSSLFVPEFFQKRTVIDGSVLQKKNEEAEKR